MIAKMITIVRMRIVRMKIVRMTMSEITDHRSRHPPPVEYVTDVVV
jgi:hypothetical protein